MATSTDQTRKAGDALILSGKLGGSDKLFDDFAAWVGAVGTIHIAVDGANVATRTDVCVITPPTAIGVPGRYVYSGDPLPIGAYLYEIRIRLTGLADEITFPNDKTKFKLIIVDRLP